MRRPRIKDIAAKAGVSTGTVDRVLHQRGDVSERSRLKVKQAMEELGYEVNLIASTLAFNRTLTIGVLLPYPEDEYWQALFHGVQLAGRTLAEFGIDLTVQHFELSNPRHFAEMANRLLGQNVTALLFAPVFEQEGLDLARRAQAAEIPYIMVNSRLANVNAAAFVGQDAYQAGYLAASLLHKRSKSGMRFAILHPTRSIKDAVHLRAKAEGFNAYFEQIGYPTSLTSAHHIPDYRDESSLQAYLHNLVSQGPALGGICVTNSRAHLIAAQIGENQDGPVLGFDPTAKNIAALKAGQIDFLINQHPKAQGVIGANLFKELLLRKQAPPPVRFLPLEIIVRENVDYFAADLLPA